MGLFINSSLQRLQASAFTSFGNEWQPKNFISPRVFGSGNYVAITTPGSSTFIIPAGVTSIRVRVLGGGGGGAHSYSGDATTWTDYFAYTGNFPTNAWQGMSGGGGGGGYAHGVFTVTPGTSYTITVGAGGQAGNPSGSAGGTSSFGALLSATGGGGAGPSAGAGGTGTGGSFQASGGSGGTGLTTVSSSSQYGTANGQWKGAGGGGAGSQLGNGGNGGACSQSSANWVGHGGGVKGAANAIAPGDAFFSYGINAAGTTTNEPNPAVFSPRFDFDIFTGTSQDGTNAAGSGAGGRRTVISYTVTQTPGVGGGAGGRAFESAGTLQTPKNGQRGGGGCGGMRRLITWQNGTMQFDEYQNFIGYSSTQVSWEHRTGSNGGDGLVVVEW